MSEREKVSGKGMGHRNHKSRINFGEIPGSIVSNKINLVKNNTGETTLTNPERKIWAERMSI